MCLSNAAPSDFLRISYLFQYSRSPGFVAFESKFLSRATKLSVEKVVQLQDPKPVGVCKIHVAVGLLAAWICVSALSKLGSREHFLENIVGGLADEIDILDRCRESD